MMAYIADKFGSFKVMKISAIATLVLIVPIFLMLQNEDIAIQIVAVSLMTIILCAFQAPIFASAVNALPEHRYRASFTAIILGSAAGIIGGTTPALMASVAKLSGVAIAPAFFILFATILSLRSMHYLMKCKS
jgi:MHS family proline/betaine transporter-like MFS transporter